jgi:hypothetical protein
MPDQLARVRDLGMKIMELSLTHASFAHTRRILYYTCYHMHILICLGKEFGNKIGFVLIFGGMTQYTYVYGLEINN